MEGATLLDIGGGIGVIQHELLDSGAAKATAVEASSAYLSAARSESERRGLVHRVTYHHGDFVDLAESIQPADVVTLERVLNVYPDWERLASLSAERAQRLYGVVIPRDTLFVRLVIAGINLALRLRGKQVRAAIVPIDALETDPARARSPRVLLRDGRPRMAGDALSPPMITVARDVRSPRSDWPEHRGPAAPDVPLSAEEPGERPDDDRGGDAGCE